MPQPPNVDGLPIWLQILVSLTFVSVTAFMAFLGYRKRLDREPPGAATTLLASFPDMGAIRHLSDVCVELTGAVQSLERCMDDLIHHERNHVEAERRIGESLDRIPQVCSLLEALRQSVDRIGS